MLTNKRCISFPEYSPAGKLTELDSQILGQESSPSFLSPNNTVLLAHQGSAVTLSCRLNNTPYFGMVNNQNTENLKLLQTSHKEHQSLLRLLQNDL